MAESTNERLAARKAAGSNEALTSIVDSLPGTDSDPEELKAAMQDAMIELEMALGSANDEQRAEAEDFVGKMKEMAEKSGVGDDELKAAVQTRLEQAMTRLETASDEDRPAVAAELEALTGVAERLEAIEDLTDELVEEGVDEAGDALKEVMAMHEEDVEREKAEGYKPREKKGDETEEALKEVMAMHEEDVEREKAEGYKPKEKADEKEQLLEMLRTGVEKAKKDREESLDEADRALDEAIAMHEETVEAEELAQWEKEQAELEKKLEQTAAGKSKATPDELRRYMARIDRKIDRLQAQFDKGDTSVGDILVDNKRMHNDLERLLSDAEKKLEQTAAGKSKATPDELRRHMARIDRKIDRLQAQFDKGDTSVGDILVDNKRMHNDLERLLSDAESVTEAEKAVEEAGEDEIDIEVDESELSKLPEGANRELRAELNVLQEEVKLLEDEWKAAREKLEGMQVDVDKPRGLFGRLGLGVKKVFNKDLRAAHNEFASKQKQWEEASGRIEELKAALDIDEGPGATMSHRPKSGGSAKPGSGKTSIRGENL